MASNSPLAAPAGRTTLIPATTGMDTTAAEPSSVVQQPQQQQQASNSNSDAGASSTLLREWAYPVAAPAVVVGEEVPATASVAPTERSTFPSYPVATFVRDFVRSSVDQIQEVYQDVTTTAAQQSTTTTQQQTPNDTVPLSVRSEADAQGLASIVADLVRGGSQQEAEEQHAVSARTVDEYMMNEEAEYILVDGDLIALPPTPLQTDGGTQAPPPKACRPSRVRRGVRKLGKLFGRNKKKNQRASSQESSSLAISTAPSNDLSQASTHTSRALPGPSDHDTSHHNSNHASLLARQTSLGESSAHSAPSSPPRGKKKKVHNKKQKQQPRKSWRQRAGSVEGVQEFYSDGGGGAEDDAAAAAAAAAAQLSAVETGVSGGLLSAAQLEAQQQQQRDRLPQLPAVPSMEASTTTPTVPGMEPIQERPDSAIATPLGTQDELLQQAGVLPPSAEVVMEYFEDEKEKKDEVPASLVPKDHDIKVDKGDVPDVESMLLRASHETISDMELHPEDPLTPPPPRPQGKTEGHSVPLSLAKRTDKAVHNDMLKVLLVGSVGTAKSALARAIRESSKKPRKRTTLVSLDAHTWSASGVQFQIWDVQGATQSCAATADTMPNFGAHPGTQSLFFSDQSLYLLVWDLACHNPHVHPVFDYDSDEEEDDDEHDGNGDAAINEMEREQAMAEADRALQTDISNRVLAWVDRIAQRAPRSAVLPVAIIPDGMDAKEIERRCSKMFEMLENHVKWGQSNNQSMPNIVLDDSRNVLCVNYSQNYGIKQIQETMVAIATDATRSVFEHVGTPVPPGTVEVMEYTRSVKHDHKLIRLDHILGVLHESVVPVSQVVRALHFLASVGEILYFGNYDDSDNGGSNNDNILSSFVILSRQWLVSALSCILRNDLKRELADARKFMNMQCIYSEQQFAENEVTKALGGGNATTSCPLLTDEDAAMLWRSMSFMREAADRYSQLSESSTSAPTMFYFLERLLVHSGIFIPFGDLNPSSAGAAATAGLEDPPNHNEVFFVPSLLSQADPGDIWGYRSTDAWTTTLCHSWLFRDGAPSDLFEHVAVALLRDLYLFTREFTHGNHNNSAAPPSRTRSAPLGRASRHEFTEEHVAGFGPVRVHQIICWKNAMLLKIGTIFPDRESGELRESFVEVFVTIVDQNSTHCVSSDAMRGSMQRVVVSGKGQSGLNGLKLFKGGYQAVLDSVQASLASLNNVNMQVVCPECLARGNPRRASTWGWDEVLATAEERREATIVCRRGHRVKSNLLCGTCLTEEPPSLAALLPHGGAETSTKPVPEMLPSIVLVGLWDPKSRQIRSVGSGFVADKRFGLIATAGHVLYNMEEGRHFGTPFLGIPDAKVVVGVIPNKEKNKNAVWRYFADVVADDVRNNVDACVLRITTRMENDVDDENPGCEEPEIVLDAAKMKDENLIKLKIETNFELEESVRILGYSQREGGGGAGGKDNHHHHILRSPDFARGYICRVFSNNMSDDSSSSSSDSESKNTFSPREEIVVRCPTIVGHSGGPCVNDEGLVVGILSRADPTDPHRCYLVTGSQLKSLVRRARGLCARPVYPLMATTAATAPRGDAEAATARYNTM